MINCECWTRLKKKPHRFQSTAGGNTVLSLIQFLQVIFFYIKLEHIFFYAHELVADSSPTHVQKHLLKLNWDFFFVWFQMCSPLLIFSLDSQHFLFFPKKEFECTRKKKWPSWPFYALCTHVTRRERRGHKKPRTLDKEREWKGWRDSSSAGMARVEEVNKEANKYRSQSHDGEKGEVLVTWCMCVCVCVCVMYVYVFIRLYVQ